MPRAILVASNCSSLPVGTRRTGVSLPQLGSAHETFLRAGWDVQVASPSGREVAVDAGSLSEEWIHSLVLARQSISLAEFGPQDANSWFVLGGHGALIDLVGDPTLHTLLSGALASEAFVGAVDHGCAVLHRLASPMQYGMAASSLIAGRRVTGRTDREERDIRHLDLLPRTTEQLLRAANTRFSSGNPWKPYVVADDNLVTGQNPASTVATVDTILAAYAGLAFAA